MHILFRITSIDDNTLHCPSHPQSNIIYIFGTKDKFMKATNLFNINTIFEK